MKKYGIKVPITRNDFVWVTSGNPDPVTLELKVLTFDNIRDAQQVADTFGTLAMVLEFVDNRETI
jgi:hypothetical protein